MVRCRTSIRRFPSSKDHHPLCFNQRNHYLLWLVRKRTTLCDRWSACGPLGSEPGLVRFRTSIRRTQTRNNYHPLGQVQKNATTCCVLTRNGPPAAASAATGPLVDHPDHGLVRNRTRRMQPASPFGRAHLPGRRQIRVFAPDPRIKRGLSDLAHILLRGNS